MVLYQPANGYCYNSDSHFLYNFICENLKKYKNIQGELLDIGSGSGILGLLIARDFEKLYLNQCEIQKEFQFFSQKNAQTNKIETTLYEGSFADIKFNKLFDYCISNPPFYSADVVKSKNKNIEIARYNDFLPFETLVKKTSSILKQNGKFFFCYDAKQINTIILVLNKYGLNIEAMQFVYPRIDKEASLIMVYVKKNSKSLTKINPALIVFEGEDFTKKVKDIYNKTKTHSIKVEL